MFDMFSEAWQRPDGESQPFELSVADKYMSISEISKADGPEDQNSET